ncbi:MAG: NAD-binding protein [Gemmatimonadaceae bacterium]
MKTIVLGGGVIGLELAQAFARFDTEVTVIKGADRVLPVERPWPRWPNKRRRGQSHPAHLWGSKSRPTPLDLVICVFSSQGMIVRCGVASALPDLPTPSESVDVARSLVGV